MSFPGQLRRVGSSADHFRSPKQRTSLTKAATSEKCQTRTYGNCPCPVFVVGCGAGLVKKTCTIRR